MPVKLRRLTISHELLDKLAKKDIRYCKDVLSRSTTELLRISDSSFSQVKSLIQVCSEAVSPKPTHALALRQNSICEGLINVNYMSTSLPALDMILRGGLPLGKITEITGPPGCGKTQFCLMLSTLVSSSMGKGAIYIDSEGAFSAQRLLEIMQARFPQMDMIHQENALKQVHIINALTCSHLMKSVESIEELVISKDIKLILIDSVASLMRKEFSSARQSIIERTNLLTRLASILKYTAEFFRIAIVATNQTTTQIGNNVDHERSKTPLYVEDCSGEPFDTGGQGELIAALGNTWSHSVNTRLILQYLPRGDRQILVAKSPMSAFGAVTCEIKREGLVQIGDEAMTYEGTDPGLQRILCKGQFPSIPS